MPRCSNRAPSFGAAPTRRNRVSGLLAGSFTIDTHVWLQMSPYFTNLSNSAEPPTPPPLLCTSLILEDEPVARRVIREEWECQGVELVGGAEKERERLYVAD